MSTPGPAPFTLASRRLGALPLVTHFARRIGLPGLLDRWVPPDDARLALDPATVLSVVVANLCIGHRPLYALGEWAAAYEPALLGLAEGHADLLNDDRAGRMLDRLFLADRGSLLTELVTGMIGEFGIDCSRLHNDSTSVSVHGAYQAAGGGEVAGVPTPAITFGHSKDRRPDLKQLVYILTVSGDHAVPVIYRLADGNTSDDPTHIPTWDQLVKLTGSADFLYVADCKLACGEAMRHINRSGGRFITVLPRSRKEDAAFRAWMQDHQPDWAEADRGPGARLGDPDQVWSVCEAPWPSAEGYRVMWVHDSGKQQRDAATRARRIEKAVAAIEDELSARLASPRTRLRTAGAVHAAARDAVAAADATHWVRYAVHEKTQESYRQAGPGRPGPDTAWRRIEKKTFEVTCDVDYDRVGHQRQGHDRRAGARRLPLPAEPGTPPPPAQGHPGRRPGLDQDHPPDRGHLPVPLHRPADQRAHRAADPHGDAGRRDRQAGDLPRVPRLRRPHRRQDLRDLRPRAAAPAIRPGRRPGPDLHARTHPATAEDPRTARHPRHRLHQGRGPPAGRPLIRGKTEARSAERQIYACRGPV